MKKLHLVCPICHKSKIVTIPKNIFNVDEGYLLKFPIQKGDLCEHEFLCIVDYNMKIRDYETGKIVQEYIQKAREQEKAYNFSYF